MYMTISNPQQITAAASFLRLYAPELERRFGYLPYDIEILPLPDCDNPYGDVLVRLGKRIYISEHQTGALGLTAPELFAAIAHELGHILYHTDPWDADAENRADTLAAELGLGPQMISVIEKIILSRRFRHLTSRLVQRIQYLSHIG